MLGNLALDISELIEDNIYNAQMTAQFLSLLKYAYFLERLIVLKG